jgi:hypothetical protein
MAALAAVTNWTAALAASPPPKACRGDPQHVGAGGEIGNAVGAIGRHHETEGIVARSAAQRPRQRHRAVLGQLCARRQPREPDLDRRDVRHLKAAITDDGIGTNNLSDRANRLPEAAHFGYPDLT